MDTLRLDLTLSRRSFELELALELGPETVALVGPSGAGSERAGAVAGLEPAARGTVACDGEVWLGRGVELRPEERSVGMLFQDYALFPHLTVEQNVAFGGRRLVPELLGRLRISHLAGRVRRSSPAASGSGSHLPARSRASRRCCSRRAARGARRAHALRRPRGARRAARGARPPDPLVTHDFEDVAALAGRVGLLVAGRLRQPACCRSRRVAGRSLRAGGRQRRARDAPRGNTGRRGRARRRQCRLIGGRGRGRGRVVVYPWEVSVARAAPVDSSLNHLSGPIVSFVPVGNRVRVRVGLLTPR